MSKRQKARSAGRRPAPRSRQTRDLPVLPLVVGGVFLAVFIALVVAVKLQSGGTATASGQPIASVQCDQSEQLAVHYHAHLTILYHGQDAKVPADIGITSSCLYWLHTHDDTGVIHVELPKGREGNKYTLGDFFQIWGQPLSSSQVATFKLGGTDQLKVFVDGKPYSGDPAGIALKSHEQIVVEIGPPFKEPPPTYTWPSDLPQ